jgi:hypothetical protein
MKKKGNMKKKTTMLMVKEKIVVKDHVLDRLPERMKIEGLSHQQMRKKVINHVKHSRLMGIKGKEEHREYRGYIYVCKYEKDLLGFNQLVVVTIKLSKQRKKEHYLDRFDAALPYVDIA